MSDYQVSESRSGRSPSLSSRPTFDSDQHQGTSRIGPSPNREVVSREVAGQDTDPWSPAVGDCRDDSAVACGHPAWAGAAGGRRGARSVADRLTSLDHVLLALLQTHRVLTTPQLITLVGRPERTVDYRLSRLREAGVVERTRPYAASGSAPFFWWLTRSGAQLAEGTSPAPGKAAPNPLFLRHSAAIAGLYVALTDLGPHIGLTDCSWRRDEIAWEEWSPSLGRAKHLRPDAHFEVTFDVDGEPGRVGAFVEIDFATMDQRRLAAKVARHRDYASDGAWWNRHPGCPALLLVTTSDARVTRFLANLERARPRPSYYGDEGDPTAWEPVAAACACVSAPEEALSAPVWRTSAADAPSTLSSLLSADVRTYRRLVATVRAQRAADEQYRRLQAIHPLAVDSERLADAVDDHEAAAAVRFLFDQVLPYNPSVKEEWAAQHLDLVTTTHTWWVEGDGRSGWPPPTAQVVSAWRALYRRLWAEQASRLLDRAAESANDPRLRRPAADLAAGTLVRAWRLERESGPDALSAAEEAALDYEARRDAAVADALRAIPLHRRIATSRAALEADYDAQHLVVCVDCAIVRHDDPEQRRYGGPARCPLCDGELVAAQQFPALPGELGDSLALVAGRLGRIGSGRL